MNNKTKKEPLFHIIKRNNISIYKKALIYVLSIIISLVICSIFCAINSKGESPFTLFVSMFDGAFGTERRIWILIRDTMLLLGVSLALIPAFKMKFWNLGANGQILIGCLVATATMFYFGDKVSQFTCNVLMILLSVLASVIWAVIPALFKALFKTNETLFTLMMNYLAEGLVITIISVWAPTGSGSLSPMQSGYLPDIINPYLLTIIVVVILEVFMYFYLNKSKHGYELSIVGDSENTARYAGMNVKKIIVRTLILSGVICGIVGVLISGSINKTVSKDIVENMGFTAIMTTWLAKFNPLVTIGTCFLITFISKGMGQVRKDFGFYNDSIGNVVLGIIYFFIIACDFFINYKIIFRFDKKNRENKVEGGIK